MFGYKFKIGELVVEKRKIFYFISLAMVALSLALFLYKTPQLSIEFTGGSLYEVKCEKVCVQKTQLEAQLSRYVDSVKIIQTKQGYIIKTSPVTPQTKAQLENKLQKLNLVIERSSTIGPSIGQEMKSKALLAIVAVVLLIVLFVAWAFREVSKPVSSFVYGAVAIIALVHDIVVPLGFYSVLGSFGAEIDTLFVVAMLAILGYSVNDTIVIFDRVRERLKQLKALKQKESFEKTVAYAIDASLARSINTSLTTLLALFALYFFGPSVVKNFVLTLMMGTIAGTYSSLFLAAPLLVSYYNYKKSKESK